MSDDQDRPLSALGFWPGDAVANLNAAAIDSAQQLLSMADTDGGMDALARQTKLEPEVVARLVDRTRAALGPSRLEGRVDTRDYGLGSLDPGDKQ